MRLRSGTVWGWEVASLPFTRLACAEFLIFASYEIKTFEVTLRHNYVCLACCFVFCLGEAMQALLKTSHNLPKRRDDAQNCPTSEAMCSDTGFSIVQSMTSIRVAHGGKSCVAYKDRAVYARRKMPWMWGTDAIPERTLRIPTASILVHYGQTPFAHCEVGRGEWGEKGFEKPCRRCSSLCQLLCLMVCRKHGNV